MNKIAHALGAQIMAVVGILLMWFIVIMLLIGWAWIVCVALAEHDSAAAALCTFVPLYIFIFALARLNKTWIPLNFIAAGLLGILAMDALFGFV